MNFILEKEHEMLFCENLKEKLAFSIDTACCLEGLLWFVPRNVNGLFKMSLAEKKVTFVADFKEEKCLQYDLFIEILFYNGELWFFPCTARKIYVLNLRKMNWRNIELPLDTEGVEFLFGAAFQNGNKVYLLPHTAASGIVVDMDTGKIEVVGGFVPAEDEKGKKEKYERCYSNSEKAYAAYKGTNYILEYDKHKDQINFQSVRPEKEGYNLVCGGEERLYLFPQKGGYVFQYTQDYQLLGKKLLVNEQEVQVTSGLVRGTEVWVSYFPNLVVKWDLTDDGIEKWEMPISERNSDVDVTYPAYGPGRLIELEQEVFCLPGDYGIMMRYDRQRKEMQEWEVNIPWDWWREYLIQNAYRIDASALATMPIREFIRLRIMMQEKNERQIQCESDILGDISGSVGEKIILHIT